jgi:hypothetical protein
MSWRTLSACRVGSPADACVDEPPKRAVHQSVNAALTKNLGWTLLSEYMRRDESRRGTQECVRHGAQI